MNNHKAAVMGTALIVLGIVLTIAIGVSVVSIQERKSSIGSGQSIMAYQNADTGVEVVLNQITQGLSPSDNVMMIASNIEADCNADGLIEEAGKFKVELKDTNEQRIGCNSGALISSVSSIKSTGISPLENRSVEVALAQAGGLVSCSWIGERAVTGNTGGCIDDLYVTCDGTRVTSMRWGC